jgi:dTDP-4-amino-4,6-dideoxygalactose transaminase
VATVNALLYQGIKPTLVDIDPETGNLDPACVEKAVTPRTRAIVPVHQLGYPADLDAIYAIADRFGLAVIEDAACALGARYKGRAIGSGSRLVCFSFHPRKAVTTAEGGAIATNDPTLAEQARMLRSHGASVSAETRHQSKTMIFEQYVDVGYNYRMSDVHAAIGIEQMKRLAHILDRRRELAQIYTDVFTSSEWIIPPRVPPEHNHAYQTYAIQLHEQCPTPRDTVIQKMADHGVSCRRGIPPVHLEPYFIERFGQMRLPVTEQVSARTLFLPLYPQMTREEQEYVIDHLLMCVRP